MIQTTSHQLEYYHQSVIYEVNIRQYTEAGTIQAFIEHLPRLKDMGVDILWFMPIHPIGIQNRKGSLGSYYSIRDYMDINPEFGTKADFALLVDQAHQLGMKVIIDWVANHAAWDNVWTKDHPEYFEREAHGAFKSPYDWTDVIQINHQHEPVHQALRDAMCYWITEFDIDGFRADLAHLTPLNFWIKARKQADSLKPNLIWLAETEDASFFSAFDIVYAWKWMHKTEAYCRDHFPVQELISLQESQKHHYPHNALELFFTSNHDENSWNGTEFEKYGSLSAAFAAFSFFYQTSIPLIYSGQEIPNTKRLSFFDKDVLNWHEGLNHHDFYRKLSRVRKKCTPNDRFEWITYGSHCLGFVRSNSNQTLVFLMNGSTEHCSFSIGESWGLGEVEHVLSGNKIRLESGNQIQLSGFEYLLLVQ